MQLDYCPDKASEVGNTTPILSQFNAESYQHVSQRSVMRHAVYSLSCTCSQRPLHHQPLLFLHQPLHILHMLIQFPQSPAPPLSPPATPYPACAHSVPSITSPSSFSTSQTTSCTYSFSPLHHQPLLFLHQPHHILHMLIQSPPSPAPPLSPPATPYPTDAHSVPSITSPSSFSTSHTISCTCSFSPLNHQPLLFHHQPHHILHMLGSLMFAKHNRE